jgi:hypothetical protein
MLETFVKEITDKTFIDEIIKQFRGSDLAQCGNCASVKINAKELAKALANAKIETELHDYSWLLSEITEGVPDECLADAERWEKWDEENEYRRLDFLMGYETERYLKFKEVLIITDPQCQCFRKEKCNNLQARFQAALQSGQSQGEVVDALLDSLARQATLELGASPNSPVHKAMLSLTRKVWELKEFLDQQGGSPSLEKPQSRDAQPVQQHK